MIYRLSYFNLDAYDMECNNRTLTDSFLEIAQQGWIILIKYKYVSRTAVSASL